MRHIARFVRFVLERVAEISLAAMALLTAADVLGRYVLDFPIVGSVELTEMLMVAVIFSGIPLATATGGQISVDIVTLTLGPKTRKAQAVLANLIATAASFFFAVVTWGRAVAAHELADQTTMLSLPLAPMVFFMSVLLFLNSLGHAADLWRAVRGADSHG